MRFLRHALAATVLALCTAPVSAATVTVIDGQSVAIDGKAFRLRGIAGLKLDETCTTSKGARWECGKKARDQLAAVAAMDEMICQPAGPDAVLCRVAGLDVGLQLVKAGLARAAGDYQTIEEDARTAKVGIWQ